MNTKFLRRATQWAEAAGRRLRHCRPDGRAVVQALRTTARALSSRCFVLSALSLLIVGELCVLGVGVVRKLDVAAQRTEHAANVYMAAVEAQAFAEQITARSGGAAHIGANAAATPQEDPAGDKEVAASDDAPPLLPRDVQTIVWEETGEFVDDLTEGDKAPAQAVEPAPNMQEPTDATGNKLSAEDVEELDRLIRKAVAAMVAGDMRLAILCLEQGRSLSPEHPALLYYYGMAYDKLLNPDKARDFYTQVFRQRDRAGKYFERASRRLTYGMAQPSAMRGKLSFGPPLVRHSYETETGDYVTMRLPIMLAPGEEVRVEDILIRLRFFVLVNNRKIEFSSVVPQMHWENATQTFDTYEENLIVTYNLPQLNEEEEAVYGTRRYYGYTAKLYYRGEPLDCISSPSALVLHEQMLDARAAREQMHSSFSSSGLLPDDGLVPDDGLAPDYAEEALPISDDELPATEDENETPFSRYIETIDPS